MGRRGWRVLMRWLWGRRPRQAPLWEGEDRLEAEVWAQLSDRPR
jgi:hypothetical protein